MPDLGFEVATQLALRKLDLVARDEVVTWAAHEVQAGRSHPCLVSLAGLARLELEEVDPLLVLLLEDLGQDEPTEFQCGMLAASTIARQVGAGALEPIEAARAIWSVARQAPASEPSLRAYVGLASEWDDDPEHRVIYDEEIRSAALVLGAWRP